MIVLPNDFDEVIEYGIYMANSTFCVADGNSFTVASKPVGCLEFDEKGCYMNVISAYKDAKKVYLKDIKHVRYALDSNTIWLTVRR